MLKEEDECGQEKGKIHTLIRAREAPYETAEFSLTVSYNVHGIYNGNIVTA